MGSRSGGRRASTSRSYKLMLMLMLWWLLLKILDVRLSGSNSSAGVLVMFRHCQDQRFLVVRFLGAESQWNQSRKKDLLARGRIIKRQTESKQRHENRQTGKHRDSQNDEKRGGGGVQYEIQLSGSV